MLGLDPAYKNFELFDTPFCKEIWNARYKHGDEIGIQQTFRRVVSAVYANDPSEDARNDAHIALSCGLFLPAGRILASAGVETNATLQNCYVSRTIDDSIEGIGQALTEAMTSLARFGGIGMDFSTIRPKGSKVGNQGLTSPGVVAWMELWDQAAIRLMQAGHRRGAMMATLDISHPDVYDFINAKKVKGALSNFNVSILVPDEFMVAVRDNREWYLTHEARPSSLHITNALSCYRKANDSKDYYMYKIVKARDLWETILQSTFESSEPGVIFIDRVNNLNNLSYCETIRATNPCGEQPLPPFGACCLGHINLSLCVNNPFKPNVSINHALIEKVVGIAVRFLDNVIDISNYPLPEQKQEQQDKRRIGLGVTGLADMLIQLGLTYGSAESILATNTVMQTIAEAAYKVSAQLGKERGTFPFYERDKYGYKGFAATRGDVTTSAKQGTRNSLLLTVAPTGTVSSVFGNVSSGIEPVFFFKQKRKVFIDGKQVELENESFIRRFYRFCTSMPIETYKNAITMGGVSVTSQIAMQAVVQGHIDASVSKTVNVPENISFEEFKQVYTLAYEGGCKGCTTYKPSDVRGSIIESADEDMGANEHIDPDPALAPALASTEQPKIVVIDSLSSLAEAITEGILVKEASAKRPGVLAGCTYKIKWSGLQDNAYLTINEFDGRPWEVFFNCRDLRVFEWSVLSCVQLSRSLRRGEIPQELADDFKKIQGAHDGHWVEGKYYTSLPQYIGTILEEHFKKYEEKETTLSTPCIPIEVKPPIQGGEKCPTCRAPAVISIEGCKKCTNCDWSKC